MLIYEQPEAVKQAAEKMKKPGESIYILPLELRMFGGSYFSVRFDKGEDCWFLIVDKEGKIPPKDKKVNDLLVAGLRVGSAYNDLSFNKKMRERKHDLTLKKYLPLFQVIREYLNKRNPKLLNDFSQYEKLLHTIIELQPKLREGMQVIKNLGEFFHDNRYITDELYEEFREVHWQTGKYMFLQGYEQVRSYEARKNVVHYLFRSGKLLWAIKLWFLHIRFSSDNLNVAQKEGFDKLHRIYIEGKQSKDEEYMLSHCRNPE